MPRPRQPALAEARVVEVPTGLTVVVLTRNERVNLDDCLGPILESPDPDVEVVVVDAGSDDGTPLVARRWESRDPRVRLVLFPTPIPVGAGRNAGLDAARPGHAVAFLSADTVPDEGWVAAARRAVEKADVVYGMQRHAPPGRGIATTLRGLRYHHFGRRGLPPEAFASHVNAVLSPRALEGHRFGTSPAESALDDVLFARQAKRKRLRIAFAPDMLVHHKDAATWQGEWRKVRREAYGWGALRRRVGLRKDLLAWGIVAAGILGSAALLASWPLALLGVLALYAPALRRALGAEPSRYGLGNVLGATLVAPALDLAAFAEYLRGLVEGHSAGR